MAKAFGMRARERLGLPLAVVALTVMVAEAADVTISANVTTGVDLDSETGTTAEVLAGVDVGNAAFSPTVTATTSAWSLSNAGAISASNANAVSLAVAGSSVTNDGTITSTSNAVSLTGGGSAQNNVGATITSAASGILIGTTSAGAGTITNAGTITQTSTLGDLVLLRFGGEIGDLATGQIIATNTSNAVSASRGTSRTVENYGLIRNTGTGFAAGVLVQGGASTVNNYAGGSIAGTYNGIYASSTTPLTLTNAGSISSTGANASAYGVEATAGGTIVNSGTIQSASSAGIYLGGTGSIANSGTIAGATQAVRFGTSNVNRSLTLGTGSALNGTVLGSSGTGIDSLVFEGSGTESLARFTLFEQLTMAGSAWTLADAGSFSQATTVASGRLTVSGTLTSPTIAVEAAGTLAGTGTVAGAVSNAGRVAVGTGTLSVDGSFASAAGAVFEVGVTPALSGLLDITGAASLAGGLVDVRAGAGTYAPSFTYTILSADGGVSGSFADVMTDLVFLTPLLTYDANHVYLTLDRSLVSFQSAGDTANQRAAGFGLDGLGLDNPLVAALAQLEEDAAPPALDAVSGEIHAALQGALALESRYPREAAMAVIEGSFAALGSSPEPSRHLWSTAYGGTGTIADDGNAAALTSGAGGLLVGGDIRSGETLLGLFGGIGHLDVAVADRNSDAEVDQYHLGVYGRQVFDGWRLKGGGVVTLNAVDTERTVDAAGYSGVATAGSTSLTTQLFGELAYAFDLGPATLSPYARLTLVGISGADYAEDGAAAALAGATDDAGQALVELGLSASASFALENGVAISLHGKLALQQTRGDAPQATHTFAGGEDFTVSGASPEGTAVLFEAGLSAALAATTSLDLSYSALSGSNGTASAFKATLSGRF